MAPLRHQLPAHSPVDAVSVLAGAAAALGGGRTLERVCNRLMERFGARDVLLTDSGTSALRLAIGGAVPPGASVALPAYGCYDLATAAVGADRQVVLYDIDPETLGPAAASLREALGQGVAALVVAPLYGMPVAIEGLRAECARAGIVLIEDAAQGAGASLNGRPVGSWGSLSVLSFGRGKGITGGGGGALLAHDAAGLRTLDEVRQACGPAGRGARALATTAALWLIGRPSVYRLPASLPFLRLGDTVYRDPWPPRAMPRPVAGILVRAFGLESAETQRRRRNAHRLLRAVRGSEGLRAIEPVEGAEPGFLRLPVIRTDSRPTSIAAARPLGVARGYPRSLVELPQVASRLRNAAAALPGARWLAERLVTLPTHGLLSEADLRDLEDWVLTCCGHATAPTLIASGMAS